MAKQTGLGDNFYAAGYNLSGDTASVDSVFGGPDALDITGIDKSAKERAGGLRGGGMSWTSWFDDAAKAEHVALSPLPRTDVHVMYFRGTTLGNPAAACVAKQVNYDPTRNTDGTFQFNVEAQANAFGLEWGRQYTSGTDTATGAATGVSIDHGAATSFGLQAYLQVFDFTGTDCTIRIIESDDDGSVDTYAAVTGGGFTQITSGDQHQERIATATNLSVEDWLKWEVITTGGWKYSVRRWAWRMA